MTWQRRKFALSRTRDFDGSVSFGRANGAWMGIDLQRRFGKPRLPQRLSAVSPLGPSQCPGGGQGVGRVHVGCASNT